MILLIAILSVLITKLYQTQYSSDGVCTCYPIDDCLLSYCVIFSSILHDNKIKLRGTSYTISMTSLGNVNVKTTVIIQDDASNITSANGDLLSKIIINNYSNLSSGYITQMELTIKDAEKLEDPSKEDIIKFGYSIKFFLLLNIAQGSNLEINIVNDNILQLNYTLNENGDSMKFEQNEDDGFAINFPYTGSGLNGDEMNTETSSESSCSESEPSDTSNTDTSVEQNIDDTGLSVAMVVIIGGIVALVIYLIVSGNKETNDKNTELLRSPPIIDPNEDYF